MANRIRISPLTTDLCIPGPGNDGEALALLKQPRHNTALSGTIPANHGGFDAMTSALAPIEVPVAETEAFKELLSRVGRKTGKIPPELIVRHVLGCVPAQEWPTRVEAMDAVLRRMESIRRDNLRVEARPAEGRLLGLYVTRRTGSGSRPYRTVLHGVDPIEGRCDCPDFLKNSLGLCKHILVVLEHLHARPRLLAAGEEGTGVERRLTSAAAFAGTRFAR